MSRISLAQQLAELSEAAPVDLDPEDVQAGVYPEDDAAIDQSAAREHYVDVAPSAIRKLHESVSDPKYDGVRTTRKQLLEESDGEEEEDLQEGDSAPSNSESEGEQSDSQEGDEEFHSDEGDKSGHANPPPDIPSDRQFTEERNVAEEAPNDDLAATLRKTRDEDRQKGKAVARQIALWDTLLDARIQMQKVVTAANRLPSRLQLQHFARDSTREALDSMFGEAEALSEELFTLQEELLIRNEAITAPPRKRRKVEDSDHVEYLRDLSAAASALEAVYHPHLIHTLAKWSAKVQAVAPSVLLGSRNAFKQDNRTTVGIVNMASDILRTDGDKLLARTRVRRGKTRRLGSFVAQAEPADEDKEDTELFDDLDFYQQLLRDVIRARGGDGGGEQDWMAQQRERKARKKLKVDTKASKGRKLRYEVHTKLQNFMVPVPVASGAWHDEQIDGLFSSLLGAG
ncbi:TRAUB-domain-containing protein [Wolfiporia cocos MD-104 SS10]|uniref:Protein BFR2 n=1 Tax=Wolfiporia cocos (strain MD-104) TaxID=742152 RepID=A0A2H3JSC3_WOLCO|nr:TRAUB-domain-containing protein [Wolfiporia cocos MD-104 SS10]